MTETTIDILQPQMTIETMAYILIAVIIVLLPFVWLETKKPYAWFWLLAVRRLLWALITNRGDWRAAKTEVLNEVEAEEALERAEAHGFHLPLGADGKPAVTFMRFRFRDTDETVDLLENNVAQWLTPDQMSELMAVGSQGWLEWHEPMDGEQRIMATVRSIDPEPGGYSSVSFDLGSLW